MPADVSDLIEIAAKLTAVAAVVKAGTPAVLKAAAEAIKTDAQALAPVGPTGDLRDSIKVGGSALRATVTSAIRYAYFNEFGTSRMPPTPFFRPATDAHEDDVTDGLELLVAKALS